MPALLLEDLLPVINVGMKYGIQIDIHQIMKILVIAGRYRIDGLVGIGHGVQERIERTLGQLNEGILCGILLRSAENGMLDDMLDPLGIVGGSPETDGEDLVGILISNHHDPGAGFLMTIYEAGSIHLGKGLLLLKLVKIC